jgi:hypothetical protein
MPNRTCVQEVDVHVEQLHQRSEIAQTDYISSADRAFLFYIGCAPCPEETFIPREIQYPMTKIHFCMIHYTPIIISCD